MNIVDLHNHLLPAVDDGSQSFDESIRHLRALRADGVTRLAVSPHLFGWLTQEQNGLDARLDRLEQVFAELQAHTADYDAVPELHFSQEILCPTPEIARAVFESPRPGVRGTRYALVEFGFDLRIDCRAVVNAVSACGRRMIVSHPERYRRDGEPVSVDEIASWKLAGAVLQVNGGSLLGDYGDAIRRTAWHLLHAGLADIISTDHHADHRPVSPKRVADAIVARGGREQARLLMAENTGRVLDDVDLSSVPAWPDRTAA
ncbi:MAG: CpsB/CapC family capsule biosynthesis tyrosine phosphatase [Gemmatimonadota bacterium]